MRAYPILIVFGILLGCSGDDKSEHKTTARVALDANAFCNKAVTSCGTGKAKLSECLAAFAAVRVSPECADALLNASCSDLASTTSSVDSICFPPCSTPGTTCNGDGTLSICGNASKTLVYDCKTSCSTVSGNTWTGICGKSAEGKTSEQDKCWCK
jgi:hypothetical protein